MFLHLLPELRRLTHRFQLDCQSFPMELYFFFTFVQAELVLYLEH
jgi:hypothetical protein